MSDIISIIQSYPISVLVLSIVLLTIVLIQARQLKQVNRKPKQSQGYSLELQLFELTAKQLLAFQSLIGEMIYRHKTIMANVLEEKTKSFLEDIHAAVELNNQRREQQLKDTLLQLITEKRQVVASDILNLNLAVKQLEMLVSKDMASCVMDIKNTLCAMLQHSESYMAHLEELAKSPFDSRLQKKLALSTGDQDTLLKLIDSLNDQFTIEKTYLLSNS